MMTKSCRFRQPLCDRCAWLWDTPEPGPRSPSGTALCIPPRDCGFTPVPRRSPLGSRPCPAGEGILPSGCFPGTSRQRWRSLGVPPACRGDAVARCPRGRNCEGILHSAVPVSLIQRYPVLGKGVGEITLPSPSFDHCVILFFSTHCV